MSIMDKYTIAQDRMSSALQNKVSEIYGGVSAAKQDYNPFLNKDGSLFNKYLDYQSMLDDPNVTAKTKQFIADATGFTPSAQVVPSDGSGGYTSTSSFANAVGTKITDTSKYNNNAAKGQCVWYVRGRSAEKLGVDPGSLGNAKDVWYNAPSDKKVSATADNLKPNMIVSYGSGPGAAAKYGHVIFIEDVVGDTVYYTEGGSTYYNKGTDGVVKTASRQGILNGTNSNGSTIGSNVVGFIDMDRY